jgi:hypothetical protein
MQGVHAMQLLLDAGRKRLSMLGGDCDLPEQLSDEAKAEYEEMKEAVEQMELLLGAAIPMVRFRCYVSVEDPQKSKSLGLGEYTVSSTNIPGIKNGLIGLSKEPVAVYAQLWILRPGGAEMLSGYQGPTKTLGFRNWLKAIDTYEIEPTIN